MDFPIKNDHFWGVLGIPPFEETPIICRTSVSKSTFLHWEFSPSFPPKFPHQKRPQNLVEQLSHYPRRLLDGETSKFSRGCGWLVGGASTQQKNTGFFELKLHQNSRKNDVMSNFMQISQISCIKFRQSWKTFVKP